MSEQNFIYRLTYPKGVVAFLDEYQDAWEVLAGEDIKSWGRPLMPVESPELHVHYMHLYREFPPDDLVILFIQENDQKLYQDLVRRGVVVECKWGD